MQALSAELAQVLEQAHEEVQVLEQVLAQVQMEMETKKKLVQKHLKLKTLLHSRDEPTEAPRLAEKF